MEKWRCIRSQYEGLFVLVSCLVTMAGCSWLDSQSSAPLVPVSIERLQEAHGQWEGMVRAVQSRDANWVTVNITNHDTFATYRFAGLDGENPFLGTGRLQLQSGRLLTEVEGRTLAERKGVPMLVVDGIGKDGKSYHAELTRAE